MSTSLKLPPTERDFEIYDAIHIACSSTRCQAELHHISQTRVRQVVRRVVEWLGEVLPPQSKVAKEQETHLARQIAADRFQRQLEQITTLWDATQETKFASIRIRLTTAQARLGVVGGLIDGLAADAVTASGGRQPTEAEAREGEAPAEPAGLTSPSANNSASKSAICNPQSETPSPPPPLSPSPTPDPAAHQAEISNLKSAIPPPPPPGDCSPSDEFRADDSTAPESPSDVTDSAAQRSDQDQFTAEYELPGLNLIEKRLLTLLENTPANDIDKRESLEQTLSTIRHAKSALELRVSPSIEGAALNADTLKLNQLPPTTAAFTP